MKIQQSISIFLILLVCCSINFILSNNSAKSVYSKQDQEKNKNNEISIILHEKKHPLKSFFNKFKGKLSETFSKSYYSQNYFKTEVYQKETNLKNPEDWSINRLDQHVVDCSTRYSAINSFKFETRKTKNKKGKKGDGVNFRYSCVRSPMISKKCKKYKTPETRTDFFVKNSLNTLVKHYLECPNNTVMNKFKLIAKGNFESGIMKLFRLSLNKFPKIFFEFSCCEAKIQRTIWATTRRTRNKSNELKNLQYQNVIAHDLNAISSFHMQCPKETIFFEMRISV